MYGGVICLPEGAGVDHIELDQHETNELLRCLMGAYELAEETDNLDVVAMAGAAMDLLIGTWDRRNDG
jgi:hypothetical protein